MRHVALAALLCATSLPAVALDLPKSGSGDIHMRQVPYNPMNRTVLVGELTRETTITFGPHEQIARLTFGTTSGDIWEGPNDKDVNNQSLQNNLPLWPIKTDPTNMQVTTLLPDGSQRIYQFALEARKPKEDGSDDPEATFGLFFTYPQDVKKEAVAVAQVHRAAVAAEVSKARLAVDALYGKRNWAYVSRPNAAWRDSGWPKPEVSDNGMLTAFRFPGNVPEPAIYIVDSAKCGPGGNERLAPFGDKDDLKVVQTTAQHFRLRLGEAVMEVCNKAYDPIGQNPGTGTTSPNVVREVVTSK